MKIFLVGGAVRDALLQLPVKEKDYVVVGASAEDLLKKGFKQVGKGFPVFLHPKTHEEYALARFERKIAKGYKGFEVDANPNITLEEDLSRRDFTINAMAKDEQGLLIDPFHGESDLKNRILRHVSPAFSEDPVRILRAARFLARYHDLGFKLAPATLALMIDMVKQGEVDALIPERVFKEFSRALEEKHPAIFFKTLFDCHALSILFPEIQIEGAGLKALEVSSAYSCKACIRFAALCHAFPENHSKIALADKLIALNAFTHRLKLPREYSDLVKMTILHYKTVLDMDFTSESFLHLFSKTDAYRRSHVFLNFIQVCQILADFHGKKIPIAHLQEAFHIAKRIKFDANQYKELKPVEIGKALHEMRLKALKTLEKK